MSMTELFSKLNAPLANSRWSWGGEKQDEDAVVLRVWQDRKRKIGDKHYMMLTHHEKFVGKEDKLGYQERNQHVERARNGTKCYMVMCLAKNVEASPRAIKSFNEKDIFVGGKVEELDGDTWIELVDRFPVSKLVNANTCVT
jgi:hypothetical protein